MIICFNNLRFDPRCFNKHDLNGFAANFGGMFVNNMVDITSFYNANFGKIPLKLSRNKKGRWILTLCGFSVKVQSKPKIDSVKLFTDGFFIANMFYLTMYISDCKFSRLSRYLKCNYGANFDDIRF